MRIALHHKGVPFDYVPVDTLSGDAWRRLNPQGLLPALEVDGRVIPQSNAILELLEERWPTPPLLRSDPVDRAEVRAFAQAIACDVHPLGTGRVRRRLAASGVSEEGTARWLRHWNEVGLASLEETLVRRGDGGRFCFGDAPTMADVHLIPALYNARRFGCDPSPYPRLLAVDAAAREAPAFVAAAPERLPDWTGDEPRWLG